MAALLQQLQCCLRCPRGAVTGGTATGGAGQLQVQPDVEHDPGGAQQLREQVSHSGTWLLVATELVHEPLGVQGPALLAAGEPAEQVQAVLEAAADRLGADLEVMAGNASW